MSKRLFTVVLICLASSLAAAEPWQNYFGSHYQKKSWAASVRDPQGAGTFAGIYDQDTIATLVDYTSDKDVIYGIGGLGSGRSQSYVDFFLTRMLLDFGEAWKNELTDNVKKIISSSKVSHPSKVIWQFGNEINSKRFAQNVFAWAGNNRNGSAHSESVIPYYVEYFLAPGVEAVNNAYGQAATQEKIRIALGSIAAYSNPKSHDFLSALLNYEIAGLCAKSLKGRKVFELVDVVTVHYIASSNAPSWRSALDEFYSSWIASSKIDALWSTEEIGLKRSENGDGAVFATQVFARYLDWWLSKGMSAQQGRAFLWGLDRGPSGGAAEDAMDSLQKILGQSTELERLSISSEEYEGSNIELYGFTDTKTQKSYVFVFPSDQKKSANLAALNIAGFKKVKPLITFQGDDKAGSLQIDDYDLTGPVSLPRSSIIVGELVE
jgi:hypothetical protein